MKYADYAKLAENLTGDNALEVCKALLERAKTDSVEYDAEITKLNEEIKQGNAKYTDLQVEFIKKFTTASAPLDKGEPESDPDNPSEEELNNEITQTLQEVL